jgi:hypothetical protein
MATYIEILSPLPGDIIPVTAGANGRGNPKNGQAAVVDGGGQGNGTSPSMLKCKIIVKKKDNTEVTFDDINPTLAGSDTFTWALPSFSTKLNAGAKDCTVTVLLMDGTTLVTQDDAYPVEFTTAVGEVTMTQENTAVPPP